MAAPAFLRLGAALLMLGPLAAAAQTPAKPAAKAAAAPRLAISAFAAEEKMTPAELIGRWKPLVARSSKRFGVPATWINAVMRMESGGRTMLGPTQRMISDKGALGIMQVLPDTYKEMRADQNLGPDPFNPADNIYAGTAYLRWLKGKYGYPAMFAAYNAGPGRLEDFLAKRAPLPEETRLYAAGIAKILGDANGTITSVAFTRPDGTQALIDPMAVRSVRTAAAGEYAPGVQAVINMGVLKQGVREDAATVTAAIRIRGGKI